MHQLGNLIKHELIDNLTSGRYILTSIVCIVLCVISIVLMSHDYQHREKESNLARGISRPPQPLSLIAKGTNEIRPVIPNFHPRYNVIGQVFMRFGEERHIFELFETPDFVYIVSIILSILTIFLSYDSICGEKETHTLSLVLSNPLRRSTFLIGKWIGGYISLLLSLSPAMLLMFIYMYTFSGVSLSSEYFLRFGGIICFTLLYLSVFFTLGILVSTIVHREATSLVLCLFFWMIWTLWIPRLALLTTRTIAPVPSEGEHRQMKEQVVTEHDITEEQREILWSMDDTYISKIDHQIALGKNLSRLSPLASYVYGSTTLAQTGIPDYQDYRRRLFAWLKRTARQEGKWSMFVHRPHSFADSLSKVWVDSQLLLLWNVLLFLGANLAFHRYDVR